VIAALFMLLVSDIIVPCSDAPPPHDFVGPPLPACAPTPEMLRDLDMFQQLEMLEAWEVLGG
jgi:hypothetical protein